MPGTGAGIAEHTSDGGKTWVKQLEVDIATQAVSFTRPSTFYFAEGYTGSGFDEWICVLNPGGTAANLTFNFQTQEEGLKTITGWSVPAHSRMSFKVDTILGNDYQTSLELLSNAPIVAERPMYFNYQGYGAPMNWTGGQCVMGARDLGTEYYFAEGTTRGNFQEWLTIQNPGDTEAQVEITYFTQEAGALPVRTVTVPAKSRLNVRVNDNAGPDFQLSCRLRRVSGSWIVVERPMYFDFRDLKGGHVVLGYVP